MIKSFHYGVYKLIGQALTQIYPLYDILTLYVYKVDSRNLIGSLFNDMTQQFVGALVLLLSDIWRFKSVIQWFTSNTCIPLNIIVHENSKSD